MIDPVTGVAIVITALCAVLITCGVLEAVSLLRDIKKKLFASTKK